MFIRSVWDDMVGFGTAYSIPAMTVKRKAGKLMHSAAGPLQECQGSICQIRGSK